MENQTSLAIEIVIRLILYIFYYISDDAIPFIREIQQEEFWLYRFPMTDSYYSVRCLWITVFSVPAVVVTVTFYFTRDRTDAKQAILGVTLSVYLTASITNCIKLGVGRPRPDFLARCFPDGRIEPDLRCTGEHQTVMEGRKSFPSGHSSFAFSSLGYVALYVAGKLHCFTRRGRGQAWRLCTVVVFLTWALLIAVSRTADYHHHWQDVSVGSVLGMTIAYICYRQYYPALNKVNSHIPYVSFAQELEGHIDTAPNTPLLPLTVNGDKKGSMLKVVETNNSHFGTVAN